MRGIRVALAALVAGLGLAAAPAAGETGEQLVYWPLVTDGTEYRRVPYPREAGTIHVLADTRVVIEARRAPVSYWPITREYLADFARDPPPVEGVVEIVDGSGAVVPVAPAPYVLWHPEGVGAGPVELLHGAAASEFYGGYVEAARRAAEAEQEYRRIVAERQAAVEAWLRMAAERPANLPKPPPELDIAEPEPFRPFASEPRMAAVVALAEGAYTVRIRSSDGAVVPGSERPLVSFGPLAEAVGYVLRPGDRWTRPVVTFAPDEAIYTTGATDLFLQPVPVVEYEAHRFARLFRPQSVEVADPSMTLWSPRPDAGIAGEGAALALFDGDAVVDTLPRTSWRVAQLAGVSRGYAIEPFEAGPGATLEPDFHAMRVGRDVRATRIGLVDGEAPVPASGRELRLVAMPAEWLLFLPALLPLAFGAALRLRLRRSR